MDSELESETAEEAAKFGNLLAVKIVEVPTLPDEEGVRIFCEVRFVYVVLFYNSRHLG